MYVQRFIHTSQNCRFSFKKKAPQHCRRISPPPQEARTWVEKSHVVGGPILVTRLYLRSHRSTVVGSLHARKDPRWELWIKPLLQLSATKMQQQLWKEKNGPLRRKRSEIGSEILRYGRKLHQGRKGALHARHPWRWVGAEMGAVLLMKLDV